MRRPSSSSGARPALYDPRFEHDACGVGFLVHQKGEVSHDLVHRALRALERLEHRGATGAEPDTGDGAGILIQIPDRLFSRECALGRIAGTEPGQVVRELPAKGEYGVGLFFGSPDAQATALAKMIFAMIVRQEGQTLLGWRRVPTDHRRIGATARSVEPTMDHVFIAPGARGAGDEDAFERKLYVIRKRFQHAIRTSGIDDRQYFHVASLSSRTLVYKGMLTPAQLREYFSDLDDPRTESALAMFHSRFSTNTFPSWELSHPYRFIAHNGEINTLRGNINWMRAREALLSSPHFDDISKVLPVAEEGLSDSACLDSVLELLVMGGRSLPHAVMMLIPEAWEHDASMSAAKKAFYGYHGCLVEPWDGPACVCFTDGRQIGAVLDRNGLRPARYWITKGGLVMLASEVGVLDVPEAEVVEKGRLLPGRMFLVDLASGRVVPDDEVKTRVASAEPYQTWLEQNLVPLEALPLGTQAPRLEGAALLCAQRTFGMTDEDLKLILAPMATRGEEALGSMGNDAALAVLSSKPRPLADYFQQLFAQVTNPPLDAIREELVTSVTTAVGPEGNLLDPRPESCRLVLCKSPFLDADAMARFRALTSFDAARTGRDGRASSPPKGDGDPQKPFLVTVLEMVFPAEEGPEGLEPALRALFAKADNAIANGSKVLVLSDRGASRTHAPIPSLLATAGLHNYLVRTKKRTQVTLIVEAGDAREVHHFATLVGYGASAIHPYVALSSLPQLRELGFADEAIDDATLEKRYLKAVEKGVVKVMSKMGISTIASYRGAQIFEAVGISRELVDRYFTLTPSRVGGVGIREIAFEVLMHHHRAYGRAAEAEAKRALPVVAGEGLEVGGQYQWRREGEVHLFDPETIFALQHASRTRRYEIFKKYSSAVDAQAKGRVTLRSLLGFRTEGTKPIPLAEVEPIEAILPRFQTGAMSYGSISAEAHETLAIAMNRIGARSNSGEGGEDPRRFTPDANGDSRRSAIKQVASARFGVTSAYLVNADELQIKMAQGAKPGEGGQLPGTKVYPWIAEVRHSTPGVGLISPPPHHDIYSIEDLAELIYDLKNANPRARVSVKLVAEVGVGTVAAGVAKAKSDAILISGHDGGTGASPLTSLKHAGVPWELGLAEAQQTLVMNRLRDRVSLAVDGQLRTGRDVVIAAMLGAEEFGFATAPLVVMGCIMMRVCHLDTCPVGIATQNPKLRERFAGRAEHVVSFFRFVAEEVREIMASLGVRTMDELVGRVDLLEAESAPDHFKARGIDFTRILDASHLAAPSGAAVALRKAIQQRHGLEQALDNRLVALAEPALWRGEKVTAELSIENVHRAVGTMLGSEVTRRYGEKGLPDDTIEFVFRGSAGQSFGAFVPRGITLRLVGDANDYVAKGLSGGRIVLAPPAGAAFTAESNVIAGNVLLYGATGGALFVRGVVGERFAVRNSGARAVVEGVGDHGCEYMTGGTVVVLGRTGRNFAAGMSGGLAFVALAGKDREQAIDDLRTKVNPGMVDVEDLDAADVLTLLSLLDEHVATTESECAKRLLADRSSVGSRFAKIIPHDEKRVRRQRELEERADAAAAPRADAAE